ncbi:MAG: hypothetical protein ABIR05_05070 [Luteimonas sp.]
MTEAFNQADTPERRRRNRRMLLLIVGIFLGTMLVAGALRFSGWQPPTTKNNGELLHPPVDLRRFAPALAAGGNYAWNQDQRLWRVVVAPPANCTTDCDRIAQQLDTVWQLMGYRADRVEVLWLCEQDGCRAPAPLGEDRSLRLLRANPTLRALLPGVDAASGLPVYVIDPNGFVILRYAPGADPGGLRADLSKLLKLI